MAQVQSVGRALEILNILTQHPHGIGVTELSNRLDVAKSTTHRLLHTLLDFNFVTQDPVTEKYKLGTQILYISNYILENINIRDVAKAKIEELSRVTNETVHLCIHDNGEVVYVDKVESKRALRMHSRIGKRGLMHCTGVGKSILAYLDEKEVERILLSKGMEAYTSNTITSLEHMKRELETIRKNGYSLDNIENEDGIRCIAAPIFDHEQNPVAAISISGPESRVTMKRIENELIEIITLTARRISRQLGAKLGVPD
nr:IclR family transcriptional regulator [Fredinandcohnia onubensis]